MRVFVLGVLVALASMPALADSPTGGLSVTEIDATNPRCYYLYPPAGITDSGLILGDCYVMGSRQQYQYSVNGACGYDIFIGYPEHEWQWCGTSASFCCNNLGDVIGTADYSLDNVHEVWRGYGSLTFPGVDLNASLVYGGLNDLRHAAGSVLRDPSAPAEQAWQAYLLTESGPHAITKADGAWLPSHAYGISNHDDVVGSYLDSGGTHAYIYRNGSLADLFPSTVQSTALAISDNGRYVAGVADGKGFLLDMSTSARANLGATAGTLSMYVNDLGTVVWSDNAGSFLRNGPSLLDLNALVSPLTIRGINNNNIVVGSTYFSKIWVISVPFPFMKGDFNNDSQVDDGDYTVWADFFGKNPHSNGRPEYQLGKGTDGGYNDGDYTDWADNFSKNSVVPEPATLSLLVLSGLAMLRRR